MAGDVFDDEVNEGGDASGEKPNKEGYGPFEEDILEDLLSGLAPPVLLEHIVLDDPAHHKMMMMMMMMTTTKMMKIMIMKMTMMMRMTATIMIMMMTITMRVRWRMMMMREGNVLVIEALQARDLGTDHCEVGAGQGRGSF